MREVLIFFLSSATQHSVSLSLSLPPSLCSALLYSLSHQSSTPKQAKGPTVPQHIIIGCSRTLGVDQTRAKLLVLALGQPHVVERAQRGEDRPSQPGAQSALCLSRSQVFDFPGGGERVDHLI